MNVKNIIDEMGARAFAYSFLQGINDLYDAKECENIEFDYQNAFNHLLTILSDDLLASLNLMEGAYTECRYYAAQYGFKCGIFGAFRHFFGCRCVEDGGFQELVANDLLMQPKMQRHREYYANIELCNKYEKRIMESLSTEYQEHMVSVTCAWQQRVYSAAMDGFYCGYRAAYDLMESINPLVKVQNMDKILTMEYHLGYIKPYSEVERLHSMAA